MEYTLLNIEADGDKIVAFFRYENGLEHSNKFSKTATLSSVLTWAKKHGDEIDASIEEAKKVAEDLSKQANLEPVSDSKLEINIE